MCLFWVHLSTLGNKTHNLRGDRHWLNLGHDIPEICFWVPLFEIKNSIVGELWTFFMSCTSDRLLCEHSLWVWADISDCTVNILNKLYIKLLYVNYLYELYINCTVNVLVFCMWPTLTFENFNLMADRILYCDIIDLIIQFTNRATWQHSFNLCSKAQIQDTTY